MIGKQHKRTELQPTMHEQADSTAYVCSVSKPHMQYVRGALAAELASDGKDYNDHSTTMNMIMTTMAATTMRMRATRTMRTTT